MFQFASGIIYGLARCSSTGATYLFSYSDRTALNSAGTLDVLETFNQFEMGALERAQLVYDANPTHALPPDSMLSPPPPSVSPSSSSTTSEPSP